MDTTHDINTLKEKYKDIKRYKTSDIALAATMMVLGNEILYIEPVNKKGSQRSDIYHFVFKDTENREKMVLQYSTNSDELKVVPNAFRSTMRYLKELTKNYNK